jgi:acetyl esterase
MAGPLRTELHPELQELAEEKRAKGTHVRSSQLSVPGARQLQRETMERVGWLADPEPVGNVRQYSIGADGGEIPVRIYTPDGEGPFPVLLWIHGGGWVRDSIDGNDPICRTLTNQAGCAVVSVGYRLAPEHPFPVGLEDCYAALEWITENPEIVLGDPDRIAVGGKSAGGNLTVALSLLVRDRNGPEIAHQLPCVPILDCPRETASYEENGDGYGLSRADMEWYWERYVRSDIDAANRYVAPLQARDLSALPPATVITAGFDPLRDDGIEYVNRLEDAGVPVTHHHYPDMAHNVTSTAFHYRDIGRTREAIETIGETLRNELAE